MRCKPACSLRSERWKKGASVNEPDPTTFYTPGPKGYTDYPLLTKEALSA